MVHDRLRAPLTASANFVLLLLIRQARHLLPLLVSLLQRRRRRSLCKVAQDVTEDVERFPRDRHLCAAACCHSSAYGVVDTLPVPSCRVAQVSATLAGANYATLSTLLERAHFNATAAAEFQEGSAAYLQMRIAQEMRHFESHAPRWFAVSRVVRWWSVFSVLFCTALVSSLLFYVFPYHLVEAIWLVSSLLGAAVVSEWDSLPHQRNLAPWIHDVIEDVKMTESPSRGMEYMT